MLKNLAIVLGLVVGLSGCMGPYGHDGYGQTEYGYYTPAYYGYRIETPVYHGASYSQHGMVQ
jgi:hypothetical protein